MPALGAALIAVGIGGLALTGLMPETLSVPLAFSAVLLAAALTANMRRNPLTIAPLQYLGEISYATYLAHFLLFVLFKIIFVGATMQLSLSMLICFLTLTALASILLYHWVERPAQRALNRHFDQLFARKAVTS